MAEFVQIRMEEILPELEQLSRIGIFSKMELKKIIKCRKEYEYKLQRRKKEEKDYIDYIDYEVKLIEKIRSRRRALGINEKKSDIEYAMFKRIIELYKNVLERFGDNLDIWYSFISFGSRVKMHSAVSRGITRMIERHTNTPEVWKVAARWHYESAKSVTEARKLLTRGLQHNPESLILYEELFKLELSSKKDDKEKIEETNKNEESIKCTRAAEIVFEAGLKSLPDDLAIDFVTSCLIIADQFTFALELRKTIIDTLIEKFPLDERTWNIVAKQELKFKITESKEQIEKCIQIYESAVEQIPTSKMWSFYLDTVFKTDGIDDVEKRKVLFGAHHAGISAGVSFLSENNYLDLLELCNNEEKISILEKVTKILPTLKLWHELLEHFIKKNNKHLIEKTVIESTEYLGELAASLWKRRFEYLMSTEETESEIAVEFSRALKMVSKPIGDTLTVLQIEFLAEKVGINAARKAYYKAVENMPPLILHEKMYEIERKDLQMCVKTCRRILEAACTQYGRNEPDIWIKRLVFELEYAPFTVSRIYNEAVRTLETKHLKLFESQFEMIRNE